MNNGPQICSQMEQETFTEWEDGARSFRQQCGKESFDKNCMRSFSLAVFAVIMHQIRTQSTAGSENVRRQKVRMD